MTAIDAETIGRMDAQKARAHVPQRPEAVTAGDASATISNSRAHGRMRFRVPCMIRYVAPDGITVLGASGKTRDLSPMGMGLLTRTHFAPGTPVSLEASLAGHKTVTLTGTVVFSRLVRRVWYHTGIRLEPIGDIFRSPPSGPPR